MVETIEIFLEQQLMPNKKTAWETLTDNEVKVEVDKHRQTKGNLDYLSWAWAWGALKDKFPSATFEKHFFDLDHQHLRRVCIFQTLNAYFRD